MDNPPLHWTAAAGRLLLFVWSSSRTENGTKALPAPRKKREKKVQAVVLPPTAITGGGLRFAPIASAAPMETAIEKPKREMKKAEKNDPRLVAAVARELRDRWLEQVNAPGGASLLLSQGKYEVSRAFAAWGVEVATSIPALPAPIADCGELSRAA